LHAQETVQAHGASSAAAGVPRAILSAIPQAAGEAATGGLIAIVARVELVEQGSATLLRLCSLVQVHNSTQMRIDIATVSPVGTRSARRSPNPREHPSSFTADRSSDAEPFTTSNPHVLEVGVTSSIPITRLGHGFVIRPTAPGITSEPTVWRQNSSVGSSDAELFAGADAGRTVREPGFQGQDHLGFKLV
jgi:hypothetical protein